MQLTLSEEERAALAEVLDEALADLRAEVYKTEQFEFREALKRRKTALEAVLGRLRVQAA